MKKYLLLKHYRGAPEAGGCPEFRGTSVAAR